MSSNTTPDSPADRLRERRGEAPDQSSQREEVPSQRYLMHPETGSVDSEENWRAEMPSWGGVREAQRQFDALIEVRLADGSDVPADFNPAQSHEYDWVIADEAPARAGEGGREGADGGRDPEAPARGGEGGAQVPTTGADRLRERRGEPPRQKSPDDELYRDEPRKELVPESQKNKVQAQRHERGYDRRQEAIAALSRPSPGMGGRRPKKPDDGKNIE